MKTFRPKQISLAYKILRALRDRQGYKWDSPATLESLVMLDTTTFKFTDISKDRQHSSVDICLDTYLPLRSCQHIIIHNHPFGCAPTPSDGDWGSAEWLDSDRRNHCTFYMVTDYEFLRATMYKMNTLTHLVDITSEYVLFGIFSERCQQLILNQL